MKIGQLLNDTKCIKLKIDMLLSCVNSDTSNRELSSILDNITDLSIQLKNNNILCSKLYNNININCNNDSLSLADALLLLDLKNNEYKLYDSMLTKVSDKNIIVDRLNSLSNDITYLSNITNEVMWKTDIDLNNTDEQGHED